MWPLYEDLTCLPPGLRAQSNTCTLGGYASYSVNVSNVAQIQLALNFARHTNVRLVVKNTGHDFADKSLGAGALSIWTHNLRELKFLKDYVYGTYKGPAFKVGAGVLTEDVYLLAEQVGVTAVGGLCRVSLEYMGSHGWSKLTFADCWSCRWLRGRRGPRTDGEYCGNGGGSGIHTCIDPLPLGIARLTRMERYSL